MAPYVDAVESTNEYDCSGEGNWAADLHSYARSLVQTLQGSDTTRALGVPAPAFCRPESVAGYGSVSGTASLTNAHDYSGGQAPELALEGRLPAWSDTQTAGPADSGHRDRLSEHAPIRPLRDDGGDCCLLPRRTLLDAVAGCHRPAGRSRAPSRSRRRPAEARGRARQPAAVDGDDVGAHRRPVREALDRSPGPGCRGRSCGHTNDLTDDVPSHVQLSAYGLAGLEVFPRALPVDEVGQLATAETVAC